jgi:hypothetical protein
VPLDLLPDSPRQQNAEVVIQQPDTRGPVLRSVTARGSNKQWERSGEAASSSSRKGDHSPYHVHVYRDGTLVVKWNLENDVAMKGKASRRILRLIAELREEGVL